ncbi:TIR domain-containing protein [Mycobacterium sp. 2YAF39]|uniref:TIR domain-containing protein n=1 Tax=Mycobacterium sp. 2YAF39 TaxID=3233033 RepID=UPI003F95C766
MTGGPVGFWSYVHDDNDAVDNAILDLRKLIMGAYSILTGEDLTLFVDTEINWGEEWEQRISSSIAGTTFFIPIITPRFFKSKACRQEVIDFTTKATEANGLNELFLPILYADVPYLSKDAEDPVIRLVAKTQYVKWHKLRLLDPLSSEHRAAVHELAEEIHRISQDVAEKPDTVVSTTGEGGPTDQGGDDADDDAPGTLDLIADAESIMPVFAETIEAMGECLTEIGEIGTASKPELDRAAMNPKVGPRLAVMQKVATKLEVPAQRYLELSTEYASQVIELNKAIDAIIHLRPYSEMSPSDQAEYLSLANSIRKMRDSANEALAGVIFASDAMQEVASLSRAMRKPASKLQRGVERMGDVQALYDEWVRGFEESGVWDDDPPGAENSDTE